MRYGEYIWEMWESGNRKTFQYLALFFFLVVIYAIYLAMHLRAIHAATESDSLFGPLAKLCLISALPFAVLAYSDKGWCSNDAAPVCVAAWITACVGLSFQCKICALDWLPSFSHLSFPRCLRMDSVHFADLLKTAHINGSLHNRRFLITIARCARSVIFRDLSPLISPRRKMVGSIPSDMPKSAKRPPSSVPIFASPNG
jgi:hypothetical protein